MKKSLVFSLCAAMTFLAACNESENWTPNTGCSDGDARCDSDKLYTCKDGDWTLGANCADSGKVCGLSAENKPACVSGPKEECVPSCKDGVVTLCDSDGNAMTHKCTDGQVCGLNTKGTPACVTMPQKSCMPYCKNGGIVTCDENMNEVFNECPDNKICEMDENHRPACVGMKSCTPMCANGVLTTCDADMNEVTKSCSDENKVCGVNENGVPACVDAAKSCMPSCVNDVLTTCDADMNEVTTSCSDENKVCGYNEFGVPACVDAAKSCMPSCVNGVLTTCDADMNEVTTSCSDENKICGVDEYGVPACVEAVVCAFGETNVLVGTKVCDAEGKVMECQADGTMSEGTACTEGVCSEGKCVRRDCDDVVDGKNVCKENQLMVCNDGELVEDTENACGPDTPLCRDGEVACSAYKDCDTIEHGKNGCKDGNIVACNDGETSVIDGGDCVTKDQFCIADDAADAGFICKTPDPTDCEWNGGVVAKNETVCDGNVLKTCSADKDGELSNGIDCAAVNNGKPFCDPKLNICRAYYNCGDNDEIAYEAIACNAKGTNKAKCNDGKLVDLTDVDACASVDNANTICTYDTEATCGFECKPGYFQKNGACEPIVTCDAVKEIYSDADNTCSCNEGAFWTGTAGSCVCAEGYVQIKTECVVKNTCSDAHNVVDETTNTCVCDSANHWIGNAASCQCEAGYVEIDGACKAVVDCRTEAHTVWVKKTNTCVCDDSKGWTGEAGSCACPEGFTEVGDLCVRKVVCNANETWVQTDNTCACNTENGWTGTAGSCTCADSNKVPAGDKCDDKVTCSEGQTYVDGLNVCACDSANGWISDGTACVCPTGYFAKDGVCTPKTVCNTNETWVETDNTCACDEANGWTGTAGSCTCDADKNLVQVGNACVEKAACTGDGQIYIENANVCACDSAKGWFGDGTTCTCPIGFVAVDGVCTLKAVCNVDGTECFCPVGYVDKDGVCVSVCTTGLTWEPAKEACVCDEANGWVRDELYGGCKATTVNRMTFGQYEQDNDPDMTNEPITWRILAVKDGKYLVISEKSLDVQQYNTSTGNVSWETCTLRAWLNDDFFNAAFSDTEKGKIVSSKVPAHANLIYSTSPGVATTDKIFLLSSKEAQYYFMSEEDRKADATRYAINNGAYVYGSESKLYTDDGTCTDIHCSACWWLRSPGYQRNEVSIVNYVGSIDNDGDRTVYPANAVRPALWVEL